MYLKSTSAGSDPKPLTLNPTSPSHAARTFLRKYFLGWFFCSVCGPNRWVWCRFVKFLVPRRRSRAKYLLARVITTGHRIKKKCQRFFFAIVSTIKKQKKNHFFRLPLVIRIGICLLFSFVFFCRLGFWCAFWVLIFVLFLKLFLNLLFGNFE